MDKRFVVILVVVIVALGGLFFFTNKSKSGSDSNGSKSTTVKASEHTYGAGKKGVHIIEYGDFECPACGAFFPVVQQVKAKYGDDIKFQFRNFPLESLHKNARAAHRTAEAASIQGKFWEMHDMLYQGQQTWAPASNPYTVFEDYAKQLSLDTAKFKTDYQSETVNDIINADIAEGQKIEATSTPTFQINGDVIDSETQQTMGTLEGFSKVIDKYIKEAAGASATPAPTPMPAQTPPPTPAPAQ